MRIAPSLLTLACTLLAAPRPSPAQARESVAQHVALGDTATAALDPEGALRHYRAALALDSTSYDALWKASRSLVDIAKQIPSEEDSLKKRRDSLYLEARALAEAAVRANPNGADGHFMVANALGRLSLTRGGKERVRFARIIYDEAMKAVELDTTHDGAYHVLGAWHAEIKRLSGIQRFFAKALFGAGFMDKANWADAQRFLEKAVALKPDNIFHRLELAEVFMDVGKFAAARAHLTAIAGLPIADVLDHEYQEDAVLDLKDIEGEKDKT
jgi:tetratricopeptide (TPR) repeat protein